MKLLNNPFGRNTHSTHEKLDLLLNDDIDQFGEFAVSVIVVGLPGIASNLGEEKIDAEWRVLVNQVSLKGINLLLQKFGGVA